MTLLRISRPGRAGLVLLISALVFAGSACAQKKGGEAAGSAPGASTPARASQGSPTRPPADAPLWPPVSGYELHVGVAKDPGARVFRSPDFQKLLVIPGKGETAFILSLKQKDVTGLPRTGVAVVEDGVQLVPGVRPGPAGGLVKQGSDILFKSGSVDFKLCPEPELVGEIALDTLLEKKPEYAQEAAAYRPGAAAVGIIRNAQRPVEIVVFFGTWCTYCREQLPRLIKTLQDAANPRIKVRYIAVDEELSRPDDLIAEYEINKTPTFSVRAGGEEIGRIEELPEKSMEEDLALILMGAR